MEAAVLNGMFTNKVDPIQAADFIVSCVWTMRKHFLCYNMPRPIQWHDVVWQDLQLYHAFRERTCLFLAWRR